MIRWIWFAFLGSALVLSLPERAEFRGLSAEEAAEVMGSGDPPLPANRKCVNSLPEELDERCLFLYGSFNCTSQQTPCTLCTPTFGATFTRCVDGGKTCNTSNPPDPTECGPKFEGTCVTQPWGWSCIGSEQGTCGSVSNECRMP
jgi:hypothetical protein